MEIFVLAAVSLALAVSSIFFRKRDVVHVSFAAVCLSLFLYKLGQFAHGWFHHYLWELLKVIGLLAMAPLSVQFTRFLIKEKAFLSRRHIMTTTILAIVLGASLLTPLAQWSHITMILYGYTALIIAVCYGLITLSITRKAAIVERTRLIYIAIAVGATAVLTILDLFYLWGYGFPPSRTSSSLFSSILSMRSLRTRN